MYINLNRASVIDFVLTENTPLSVIKFLVNTCGKNISEEDLIKKRENVLKFLNKFEINIDDENLTNNNLVKISTYVSDKKCNWDKNNLLKAYMHIKKFNQEAILCSDEFGSKDNDNVSSHDVLMCYKLCLIRNIETNSQDTLETLKEKLTHVQEEEISNKNEEELYNSVLVKLGNADKQQLIKIDNMLLDNKLENFNIVQSTLKLNINCLVSKSCLNHREAVLYAAKFFNLDLSECDYPSRELFEFNKCKLNSETYKPTSDDLFSKNYGINEEFYLLDKFWKKSLEDYYNPKVLQSLLSYECCENVRQLENKMTKNNFYIGIVPTGEIREKTHLNKYNISNVTSRIISYGNIETKNMLLLTVTEIIEYWQEHNYFKDFTSNDWLDYDLIDKLYNITRDYPANEKMYELTTEIKRIKKLSINNSPQIKNLLDDYLMLSDKVDMFFTYFFKVGLSLRGWSDDKEFPLSDTKDLEPNVEKLKYCLERLSSVLHHIKYVPIVQYKDNIFVPDPGRRNLSDLCNEKLLLEDHRALSKTILSTSHYYVKLLNNKELFNIENLT